MEILGLKAEKSGRNDILIDGKKFSGNAFYEQEKHCYHHGTIMVGVNMETLSLSLIHIYGPQFYDEDTITDQPERQIVAELIREKALHCLNEEIPHGIAVSIEKMKARKKVMDIEATIICERDSHKGIIIGKQGSMLKKIGSTARYEIEQMLECKVNLQLWVKVKKDWRDSDFPVSYTHLDVYKRQLEQLPFQSGS